MWFWLPSNADLFITLLCVSAHPCPPSGRQLTPRSNGGNGWRSRWGVHGWRRWCEHSGRWRGGRLGSSSRERAPPQLENEIRVWPVLERGSSQRARQEPEVLHCQSSAQVRPVPEQVMCYSLPVLLPLRIWFVSPQLDQGAPGPLSEIFWEEKMGCRTALAFLPHLSTAIWCEFFLFFSPQSSSCSSFLPTPQPHSHAEYSWLSICPEGVVLLFQTSFPLCLISSCRCDFCCVFLLTLSVVA